VVEKAVGNGVVGIVSVVGVNGFGRAGNVVSVFSVGFGVGTGTGVVGIVSIVGDNGFGKAGTVVSVFSTGFRVGTGSVGIVSSLVGSSVVSGILAVGVALDGGVVGDEVLETGDAVEEGISSGVCQEVGKVVSKFVGLGVNFDRVGTGVGNCVDSGVESGVVDGRSEGISLVFVGTAVSATVREGVSTRGCTVGDLIFWRTVGGGTISCSGVVGRSHGYGSTRVGAGGGFRGCLGGCGVGDGVFRREVGEGGTVSSFLGTVGVRRSHGNGMIRKAGAGVGGGGGCRGWVRSGIGTLKASSRTKKRFQNCVSSCSFSIDAVLVVATARISRDDPNNHRNDNPRKREDLQAIMVITDCLSRFNLTRRFGFILSLVDGSKNNEHKHTVEDVSTSIDCQGIDANLCDYYFAGGSVVSI
jgi:hypothetical protein